MTSADPVFKTRKGWWANTDEGISGPWMNEQAARHASEGNFEKANRVNWYEQQKDKTYGIHSKTTT